MGISKIILNDLLIADISNDSVDRDNLCIDETAHKNNGRPVVGNYAKKDSIFSIDSDGILHYYGNTAPEPCQLKIMTYNVGGWYMGEDEKNVPLDDETKPDALQVYSELQTGIMERNKPDIAVFQEAWNYFAGNSSTPGSILATDVIGKYFPTKMIQFDKDSKHYCRLIGTKHFPFFGYLHKRFDIYNYKTDRCQDKDGKEQLYSSELKVWDNTRTYGLNEYVHYPSLIDPVYRSLVSNNTSSPTDTSKWQKEKLHPSQVNIWINGTSYDIDDFVHYPTLSDPIYRSLVSSNTSQPTDTSKWRVESIIDPYGLRIWESGKTYNLDDYVHYPTLVDPMYKSLSNNNSSEPTDTSKWVKDYINPYGMKTWDSAKTYGINEFVHYPTITDPIYQSLSANNVASPTDSSKWKLADWFYGYEKAYVKVNGHDICIVNTWLDSNDTYYWFYRIQEIAQLIEELKNEEYFVLLGDFNTNCRAYGDQWYNCFIKPFIDAGFHVCNNALDENDDFVSIKTYYRRTGTSDALDQIITSSNIIVKDFFVDATKKEVLERRGDKVDHLPVIADLIIN